MALRLGVCFVALALSGCIKPVSEATCTDKTKNGTETDVDCGGACAACAPGKACSTATDCSSMVCTNSVCDSPAPSCSDRTKNQNETDIDCGGRCPPCTIDGACLVNADCASLNCVAGKCAAPASCSDGLKNQDETDVDCGGGCHACSLGAGCLHGGDCTTGVCTNNICVASSPSCTDMVRDGTETDVDCGGGCTGCALGKACTQAGDCASGNCTNLLCVAAPSCSDMIRDGTETDVDCGGPCAGCAIGGGCARGADCASGVCSGMHCIAAPTCSDMTLNGTETDVDCGGSCAPCAAGETCLHPYDCQTSFCVNNHCVTNCGNGVRDGAETSVDCGGGTCPACPLGASCNQASDCISGDCNQICITASSCSNGIKDGTESDVDCGGPCAPCLSGLLCTVPADCLSNVCSNGRCYSLSSNCADDVKDFSETAVDCGGGCLGCAEGEACQTAADCFSQLCNNGTCAAATGGIPPGASLAVFSADGGSASLFVIGNDRSLWVDTFASSTGSWSGLTAALATGTVSAPPGAPIAGCTRAGMIDVFFVDDLGALQDVHIDTVTGTTTAAPIRADVGFGGTGTAVPGSRPSAVVMFDTRIDVVVVDKLGELLEWDWTTAQGAWGAAVAISPMSTFALGAPGEITTTEPTRVEEDFLINSSGNIWDNWCDQGCTGSNSLGSAGHGGTFALGDFPVEAFVTSFSTTTANQDVLVIDKQGEVRRQWLDPGFWHPLEQFSAQGTLSPLTTMSAAIRNTNAVDLFATDSSGAVRTVSWNGTWTGGSSAWGGTITVPWSVLLPPASATPNSDIATVPNLNGTGALDVFWVAPVPTAPDHGEIWTQRAYPNWGAPKQLY